MPRRPMRTASRASRRPDRSARSDQAARRDDRDQRVRAERARDHRDPDPADPAAAAGDRAALGRRRRRGPRRRSRRSSTSSRSTRPASDRRARGCAGNCCARPGNTPGIRSTACGATAADPRSADRNRHDRCRRRRAGDPVAEIARRALSLGGARRRERRAIEPALPCRLVGRGGLARRARQTDATLDKTTYQPGETAKLFVKAPFAGEAELAIASDRILALRSVNLPAEGTTVEIPVDAAVGQRRLRAGQRLSPAGAAAGPAAARRAAGARSGSPGSASTRPAHARRRARRARCRAAARPGRDRIKVAGLAAGRGGLCDARRGRRGGAEADRFRQPGAGEILSTASASSGSNCAIFTARLIDPRAGGVGVLRSGGDQFAKRSVAGLPDKSNRVVALFSGIVRLDGDGAAKIHFDMPDFQGQLRLMAVAFSAHKLGSASGAVTVRDPVVTMVSLPRFLAPGDTAQIGVVINNLEGAAGDYRAELGGDRRRRRSPRRSIARSRSPPAAISTAASPRRRRRPAMSRCISTWPGPTICTSRATSRSACGRRRPISCGALSAGWNRGRASRSTTAPPTSSCPARPRRYSRSARARIGTCPACCARSTATPMAASSRRRAAPCRCSMSMRCRSCGAPIPASRRRRRSTARSATSSNCSARTAASGCGATATTRCRGSTPTPPISCCAPRSTARRCRITR